jgi:hypothetical protein
MIEFKKLKLKRAGYKMNERIQFYLNIFVVNSNSGQTSSKDNILFCLLNNGIIL